MVLQTLMTLGSHLLSPSACAGLAGTGRFLKDVVMARKKLVTSKAEQVRIMANADREFSPPEDFPLNATERRNFDAIIKEFAKTELDEHKLQLVAILARTIATVEKSQRQLAIEGETSMNTKGQKSINPLKKAIQMDVQQIINLRRTLMLNVQTRKDDYQVTRSIMKQTERSSPFNRDNDHSGNPETSFPELDDADLIARPMWDN